MNRYIIIDSTTSDGLASKVNEMLEAGYTLIGSPFVGGRAVAQAMLAPNNNKET